LLSSKVVDLEQHAQPGRGQELHPVKVDYHESGGGQLGGQKVGQSQRGQRVNLAHDGHDACVGTVLDHL